MTKFFLIFGGYEIFVWPAFLFTIICYLFLYFKTSNELKMLDKKFKYDHVYTPVENKIFPKKELSNNTVQ
tara:strand:+ start:188 stop:397 length:210 start_codon:yes stop_codon:yes gene_type:complete